MSRFEQALQAADARAEQSPLTPSQRLYDYLDQLDMFTTEGPKPILHVEQIKATYFEAPELENLARTSKNAENVSAVADGSNRFDTTVSVRKGVLGAEIVHQDGEIPTTFAYKGTRLGDEKRYAASADGFRFGLYQAGKVTRGFVEFPNKALQEVLFDKKTGLVTGVAEMTSDPVQRRFAGQILDTGKMFRSRPGIHAPFDAFVGRREKTFNK